MIFLSLLVGVAVDVVNVVDVVIAAFVVEMEANAAASSVHTGSKQLD